MALQQGAGSVAPATAPQSGSPGWGLFAGGVLLGGTVAAGAAYLAVRYANTSGAGEEGRRGGGSASRRRTAGRWVPSLSSGSRAPLCLLSCSFVCVGRIAAA
jgi:hypothetical protein